MNPLQTILAIVCLAAFFVAGAGEPPAIPLKRPADQPITAELQPLQGTWEGIEVGDKSHAKITVTIISNSFHFHRDTNFWFATTITLPTNTHPKQLRATIKGCPPSQADSIGQEVSAIFKIEDGKLTIAQIGDDPAEAPKSFEAVAEKGQPRYELRKTQPPTKAVQSSPSE